MKTVSKKLFSLLLVMVMLVSIVPFAAFANEEDGSTTGDSSGTTTEDTTGDGSLPCPDCTKALSKVDEVPATCAEAGTKEYWECESCHHRFFYDGLAATFIKAESLVIQPLKSEDAHHWVVAKEGEPANCTTDGKEPLEKCDNPGCTAERGGQIISKLNNEGTHTWNETPIRNEETSSTHFGEYMYYCKNCPAIKYEKLPAEGSSPITLGPFTVHVAVKHPFSNTMYEDSEEIVAGHTFNVREFVATTFGDKLDALNSTGYRIVKVTDSHNNKSLGNGEAVTVNSQMTIVVEIKFNSNPQKAIFVAEGGYWKVGSSKTPEITVTGIQYGDALGSKLPETPTFDGYIFKGWSFTSVPDSSSYKIGDSVTASTVCDWEGEDDVPVIHAVWEKKQSTLKVLGVKANAKGVVDPDAAPVVLLTQKVDSGVNLLDTLAGLRDDVRYAIPYGYHWYSDANHEYWYNYNVSAQLTSQSKSIDTDTTVCIKMYPNKITLTFNPNGGTMKEDKKHLEVDYMEALPELPSVTFTSKKFKGWTDEWGKIWTKGQTFTIDHDTTLRAVWSDEADVWLNIYINGDKKNAVRYVPLGQKELGEFITKTDILNALSAAGVVAKSGTSLNLNGGIFTETQWANYVATGKGEGELGVEVEKILHTDIYVMVDNAVLTGGTGNNTPVTTKPTDRTLPKTGDTTMIYTAASVMVLAAAALVTVQVIRKKKSI